MCDKMSVTSEDNDLFFDAPGTLLGFAVLVEHNVGLHISIFSILDKICNTVISSTTVNGS